MNLLHTAQSKGAGKPSIVMDVAADGSLCIKLLVRGFDTVSGTEHYVSSHMLRDERGDQLLNQGIRMLTSQVENHRLTISDKDDKERQIVECLVDGWIENGCRLYGGLSYQDAAALLQRMGALPSARKLLDCIKIIADKGEKR
jgi:hypothetical protein